MDVSISVPCRHVWTRVRLCVTIPIHVYVCVCMRIDNLFTSTKHLKLLDMLCPQKTGCLDGLNANLQTWPEMSCCIWWIKCVCVSFIWRYMRMHVSACVCEEHIQYCICMDVQHRAGLHMFMSLGTCVFVNLVHPSLWGNLVVNVILYGVTVSEYNNRNTNIIRHGNALHTNIPTYCNILHPSFTL